MKCMPFWKACNRHVEYVDQRHRNLTEVPLDIMRHAKTLEELLLDENQIHDVPKSFYQLLQLRKLTLSDNQMCVLSPDISCLVNLQELDLSRNDLEEIPNDIRLCRNLQIVNFSNNPIQQLPDGLMQLKCLTHLCLNDISITTLPSTVGDLVNLETLELRENLLRYLPQSLGILAKLKFLDLGTNMIEEIPEYIGALTNLEEFRIDGNELCELPSDIGQLKRLLELDVSENRIEKLPQEIGGLTSLTDLHLSQNQIEFIPDGIGLLKKLTTLKVDQNHLTELTSAIGGCTSLQELTLTENLISELPKTIGKLKSLMILNVDRNRLSGIPNEIGSCSKLGILSLRDNTIWKVPAELGHLKELRVLDISGNRLQHLPLSVGSCSLKAIWLSDNQAQPLLKFQQDIDEETGDRVLTCFLLPQQAYTESMENLLRDSFAMSEQDTRFSNWPAAEHPRTSVKFADNERASDSEDETGTEQTNFVRHNTPHPKDLRLRHNKMFGGREMDVDGRVIPHKPGRIVEDSGFIPSRDSSAVQPDLLEGAGVGEVRGVEDVVMRGEGDDGQVSMDDTLTENTLNDEDQKTLEEAHRNGLSDQNTDDNITRQLVVHIVRAPGTGLGISIAGGKGSIPFLDDDEGIFVSKVSAQGAAEKAGVSFGDKILSVNGVSLVEADHAFAVSVLKSAGNDITIALERPRHSIEHMVSNYVALSRQGSTSQQHSMPQINSSTASIRPNDDVRRPNIQHSTSIRSNISSVSSDTEYSRNSDVSPSIRNSVSAPRGLLNTKTDYTKPGMVVAHEIGFNGGSNTGVNGRKMDDSRLYNRTLQDQTNSRNGSSVSVSRNSSTNSGQIESNGQRMWWPLAGGDGGVSMRNKDLPVDKRHSLVLTTTDTLDMPSYPTERIVVVKGHGPLGLSIVGGRGHTSHPFGMEEPGVFISKILPSGPAAKTSLRIGDRLLAVNGRDIRQATHQEAVQALVSSSVETVLEVRHDPQPSGLQEVRLRKQTGEKMGLCILGGAGTPCVYVHDDTDEGVFISKIISNSVAARDGRLKAGMRILEVNGTSLLGTTQQESVISLQSAGNNMVLLVCDGYNKSVSSQRENSASPPRHVSMYNVSSSAAENTPQNLPAVNGNHKLSASYNQGHSPDVGIQEHPTNQNTALTSPDHLLIATTNQRTSLTSRDQQLIATTNQNTALKSLDHQLTNQPGSHTVPSPIVHSNLLQSPPKHVTIIQTSDPKMSDSQTKMDDNKEKSQPIKSGSKPPPPPRSSSSLQSHPAATSAARPEASSSLVNHPTAAVARTEATSSSLVNHPAAAVARLEACSSMSHHPAAAEAKPVSSSTARPTPAPKPTVSSQQQLTSANTSSEVKQANTLNNSAMFNSFHAGSTSEDNIDALAMPTISQSVSMCTLITRGEMSLSCTDTIDIDNVDEHSARNSLGSKLVPLSVSTHELNQSSSAAIERKRQASEEERKVRAEQRRLAREKFLEDASVKMADTNSRSFSPAINGGIGLDGSRRNNMF